MRYYSFDGKPVKTCACGCGTPVAQDRRFVSGHNSLGRKKPNRYRVEDRGHDTPCWIWALATKPNGYGHVRVDGRDEYAHRAYWREAHGPIPTGLDLDHLCRVRACVNPDHLEPVTRAENMRRSWSARKAAA